MRRDRHRDQETYSVLPIYVRLAQMHRGYFLLEFNVELSQ